MKQLYSNDKELKAEGLKGYIHATASWFFETPKNEIETKVSEQQMLKIINQYNNKNPPNFAELEGRVVIDNESARAGLLNSNDLQSRQLATDEFRLIMDVFRREWPNKKYYVYTGFRTNWTACELYGDQLRAVNKAYHENRWSVSKAKYQAWIDKNQRTASHMRELSFDGVITPLYPPYPEDKVTEQRFNFYATSHLRTLREEYPNKETFAYVAPNIDNTKFQGQVVSYNSWKNMFETTWNCPFINGVIVFDFPNDKRPPGWTRPVLKVFKEIAV